MNYQDKPHKNVLKEDLFGTKEKIKAIIDFFEDKRDALLENHHLMALYGEWGSGKSTLLHALKEKLSTGTINPNDYEYEVLYFEAWKFENDDELTLSLFDMILEIYKKQLNETDDLYNTTKSIAKTFLTFGKNIALSSKINFWGIELDLGKAGEDTINELQKANSYYELAKQFEEQFNKLVGKITENKPLLIIIDDLDRCEPENTLKLLSSIKHFFNHEKLLYFCAIDKNAINNAIKIKYGDIIEPDEYLNKLFTLSFNMPRSSNTTGIINYFIESIHKELEINKDDYSSDLLDLLQALNINNPREIKKLFNKFLYLLSIKELADDAIFRDFNKYKFFFLLFLITLHDNNRDTFQKLYEFESRKAIVAKNIKIKERNNNIRFNGNSNNVRLVYPLIINELKRHEYNISFNLRLTSSPRNSLIAFFILIVSLEVNEVDLFNLNLDSDLTNTLKQFLGNNVPSKNLKSYNYISFLYSKMRSEDLNFKLNLKKYLEFAELYF